MSGLIVQVSPIWAPTRKLNEVFHTTKWTSLSNGTEVLTGEWILGIVEEIARLEANEYEDGKYFTVWLSNTFGTGKKNLSHLPLEYPSRRTARKETIKMLLRLHSSEKEWFRFFQGGGV